VNYLRDRVKGALQLQSKRHKYIRFAHVHGRVVFSRSDGENQRFTHETRKNSEQAIGLVETETVVHYESQRQSN